MRSKLHFLPARLLVASVAAATALALDPAAAAMAAAPSSTASPATLPAEQKQNGIAYITGGVGEGQAKAFKEQMNKYPLAIELLQKQWSGKRDEFTANAEIRITDHAGKEVFKAQAQGPFMLVRLEPGKYSMTARFEKHTLHRKNFTVAKEKTTHETFVFPAQK